MTGPFLLMFQLDACIQGIFDFNMLQCYWPAVDRFTFAALFNLNTVTFLW